MASKRPGGSRRRIPQPARELRLDLSLHDLIQHDLACTGRAHARHLPEEMSKGVLRHHSRFVVKGAL